MRVEQKDARGLLVAVVEYPDISQAGVQTTYQYDALGRLAVVTDSMGKSTEINYDTLSRKRDMRDPAMGRWAYSYDANGNLASQTDAKSQTISFACDAINRLVTKTYPNNTTIGYEYDNAPVSSFSNGKLTRVTVASGVSEFTYPEVGVRTVSKTVTGVNSGNPFVVPTVNDALGRVSMIRYPDNEEVNYTYDSGGNLATAGDYATFGNYSALGQPGTITYHNNVVTGMTYNDGSNTAPVDYRLHSLTTNLPADGKKQDYVYTYDPSGNITDIEDLVQTARNRHFTYDGLNRLIQASWPNDSQAQSVTMEYYSNGNIKSKTGLGSEPSSSPLTGHDLVYDYDNRLKEISGLGVEFVYDFQGARVKKILGTPPATTTTVYIGNLYELTEGVSTKHIFAGGRRIASKTGTEVIYHHPDHLGGLHLATKSDGSLLQTATYYPFGENNEGSDSGIKYRFTGQEKDFESGLYYFGARFYDPVLGRFISPDPTVQSPGDPQTFNRYAYADSVGKPRIFGSTEL